MLHIVWSHLRTLQIVWSLVSCQLLGVSPGSKLRTTFLNIAKNDEIKTKNQFTGTATQPQRNRNATANYDNLIMTSTVSATCSFLKHTVIIFYCSVSRGFTAHVENLRCVWKWEALRWLWLNWVWNHFSFSFAELNDNVKKRDATLKLRTFK